MTGMIGKEIEMKEMGEIVEKALKENNIGDVLSSTSVTVYSNNILGAIHDVSEVIKNRWLADSKAKDKRIRELTEELNKNKILDLRFVKNTKEYKELEFSLATTKDAFLNEKKTREELEAKKKCDTCGEPAERHLCQNCNQNNLKYNREVGEKKFLTTEEAMKILNGGCGRLLRTGIAGNVTKVCGLDALCKYCEDSKKRFTDIFAKKGVDLKGVKP